MPTVRGLSLGSVVSWRAWLMRSAAVAVGDQCGYGECPFPGWGMKLQPHLFLQALGWQFQKSCWGSSWAPPQSLTSSSQFRVSVSKSAFPGHSNRSRNSSLYRALTLTLCPTPMLMCFFCLMGGPTCWNKVDILG